MAVTVSFSSEYKELHREEIKSKGHTHVVPTEEKKENEQVGIAENLKVSSQHFP